MQQQQHQRPAGSSNNKKKSRGNKKKKKHSKKTHAQPVLTLEQTIAKADEAATKLDPEQAATLYASAATQLRARLAITNNDSNPATTAANGGRGGVAVGSNESNVALQRELVRVCTKLGETKVAIGDRDGAVADFRAALELTDDAEQKAGLYLYTGQLSVEDEALEMYRKGIEQLQRALDAAVHEQQEKVASGADTAAGDAAMMETDQETPGTKTNVGPVELLRYVYMFGSVYTRRDHLESMLQVFVYIPMSRLTHKPSIVCFSSIYWSVST